MKDQFNDMKYGHVLLENLMYYWDKSFAVLQNAKINVRPCEKRPYEEIFYVIFRHAKVVSRAFLVQRRKTKTFLRQTITF